MKFVAYDFASGKEIAEVISNLKSGISVLEEQPVSKKTQKIIDKKIQKLKSFEDRLLKDTAGTPATRPSNKEIFHRIRNAFSHKQIYNCYNVNAETNISDSIDLSHIILTDEDKFVACVDIDDLISLLMDQRFYDALIKIEKQKGKNK